MMGSTTRNSAAVQSTMDQPGPTAAASTNGKIAAMIAPMYGIKRRTIASMPHKGRARHADQPKARANHNSKCRIEHQLYQEQPAQAPTGVVHCGGGALQVL